MMTRTLYVKNRAQLRALAVDDGLAENGTGPISPSATTIADATYQPLSRPLFIYTTTEAVRRKEVDELVRFYLRAARLVAADVGYVPLPAAISDLAHKRLAAQHVGSVFSGLRSSVGITMQDLLQAETAELVEVRQATARP